MLARAPQVPQFGESLEAIFTKRDMPTTMRTFLIDQVPPVTTVDVLASGVSGPDTLEVALLDPAGFGDFPAGQ